MILRLYNCDNSELIFDDNVLTLEVEKAKVFTNIILDFVEPIFPAREVAVFNNDDNLVKTSEIMCIFDFINFDIENRTLMTRIYKHIEKQVFQDFFNRQKFNNMLQNFKNDLLSMFYDLDIDFSMTDEYDIKDFLSAFKLSPLYESDSILDKMLQYINIVSELKLFNLLVLINVKSYLENIELEQLFQHALYKNVRLLLIENSHKEKIIKNEQKLYLDDDFCDIILK